MLEEGLFQRDSNDLGLTLSLNVLVSSLINKDIHDSNTLLQGLNEAVELLT